MGRPSRFDNEFKAQACELARSSRRPRSRIAADLGVSDATLARWMTEQNSQTGEDTPLSVDERAELEQLRAEKRQWTIEREILKKASMAGAGHRWGM